MTPYDLPSFCTPNCGTGTEVKTFEGNSWQIKEGACQISDENKLVTKLIVEEYKYVENETFLKDIYWGRAGIAYRSFN